MKFQIKKTQEKEPVSYKTLYIKQGLVEKITQNPNISSHVHTI